MRYGLDHPCKLSVEADGDRFHNLHVFANGIEQDIPQPEDGDVVYVMPGTCRSADLVQRLTDKGSSGEEPAVLYFGQGLHRLEEGILSIPSGKTVYLAGGAMVIGSMRDIEKTTHRRSVQIDFSRNIRVEDIISVDPPHYSIHLGFKEDTRSITVSNSILWADAAHPINIGCHGDHGGEGDVIEDIRFDQIDILEHHEPQEGYWGCMGAQHRTRSGRLMVRL